MREVEIKAKIPDHEIAYQRISDRTGQEWEKPITQIDVIFLPHGISFASIPNNTAVLRIRYLDNATLLTYKKSNVENPLDRIEHEVSIENGQKMEKIVRALGFEKAVTVKKKRQKIRYDNYELVLDEVDELGHFLEIETFTNDDRQSQVATKNMIALLDSFGIGEYELVHTPYDALIFQKNNPTTQ